MHLRRVAFLVYGEADCRELVPTLHRCPRPAVQDDQVRVRLVRPAHSEVQQRAVDDLVVILIKSEGGKSEGGQGGQKQQATEDECPQASWETKAYDILLISLRRPR